MTPPMIFVLYLVENLMTLGEGTLNPYLIFSTLKTFLGRGLKWKENIYPCTCRMTVLEAKYLMRKLETSAFTFNNLQGRKHL